MQFVLGGFDRFFQRMVLCQFLGTEAFDEVLADALIFAAREDRVNQLVQVVVRDQAPTFSVAHAGVPCRRSISWVIKRRLWIVASRIKRPSLILKRWCR